MDREEDGISRDHRQHIMECDVGRLKAIEIPERLAIVFQRDLEVGNILPRREVGGGAQ